MSYISNVVTTTRSYNPGKPLSLTSARLSPFWLVWFVLCYILVSSGEGYSVNYLFALTPLVFVARGGKLYYPKSTIVNGLFSVSIAIFVIAFFYQIDFYEYGLRRIISFFIFMTIFSLPLIRFTPTMMWSALAAIIPISVYYSLNSLYKLFISGIFDPSTLKAITGTQRIGFLYLFAFSLCCLIFSNTKRMQVKLITSFALLILFTGLITTFSRASYVGFLSGVLFALFYYGKEIKFKINRLGKFLIAVAILALVFFAVYVIYPDFFNFINDRFLSFIYSDNLDYRLSDAHTSEGARIAIWSLVFDFVLRNPFTGSGFLGSWVLSDWSGSSHSEFLDRLLRLGLFGFLLYLLLLWKIFKFLLKTYPLLASGFLSILVYGLFHETFSQSQAAVLFSLLMAFCCNRMESSDSLKSARG